MSAAVFGDVTSANVVGYMNKDSNTGTGYTMLCPNFLSVSGGNTSCKLSELSVTGYTGMSAGQFMLKPLTATGTADGGPYYWVDIPVQSKKGWFLNQAGSTPIPGGAESVEIDAGRGIWCQGRGLKLVMAGSVNEALVAFTSNTGTGYTAMGNCTPVNEFSHTFVNDKDHPEFDQAYMVVFDADKVYISDTYAIEVDPLDATVGSFNIMATTGSDNAPAAASSYAGAGWYNVPEPTSGLLLLIGVAGLALRRRRA